MHAQPLSLQKCPCCRARMGGDEPPEEPCRRCDSDLSSLRRAYAAARGHSRQALLCVVSGDYTLAHRYACRAVAICDHPDTRQTLAVTLALTLNESQCATASWIISAST